MYCWPYDCTELQSADAMAITDFKDDLEMTADVSTGIYTILHEQVQMTATRLL